MPSLRFPRAVDTAVAAPAGCAGSITYRPPGESKVVTYTFPIAHSTPKGPGAVHVSTSRPSFERTRETVPPATLVTQRCAPSDLTNCVWGPRAVKARLLAPCVV